MVRIRAICAPLLAAALIAAAAGALAARKAWVVPRVANVRSGPGLDKQRLAQVTRGTQVTVLSTKGDWCRVRLPSGKIGWIARWLLEFDPKKGRRLAAEARQPVSTAPIPAWVRGNDVNVRSGPGLGYSIRGKLDRGTKVYVVARQGEWCRCRTPGGWGWIRSDLLEFDVAKGRKLAAQASQAASRGAQRSQQAKRAQSGGTPSAKGFINATNVRLRAKPTTNSRIVAVLQRGQTVYVVDRVGDWYRVRVHGGNAGWVYAEFVKILGAGSGQKAASGPSSFPSPRIQPKPLVDIGTDEKLAISAWAAGDAVNVRAGPGLAAPVRGKLSKGEKVRVLGVHRHWVYVQRAGGQKGWVAGWLLNFCSPDQCTMTVPTGETVPVRVGWVMRPEVNVRTGPGLEHKAAAEATLGEPFIVLSRHGQWLRVAFSNGKVGWVASWLVDTREQRLARQKQLAMVASGKAAAEAAGTPSLGEAIVRLALQFVGYPYVHGGESPSGFDCSGFVKYILGRFGIRVPHSTAMLFRHGRPVSRDELQPGDIVFFKNTYRRGLSHVGIYIGDGKFVHASTRRTGVRISSLNKPFYKQRYVGARRMY